MVAQTNKQTATTKEAGELRQDPTTGKWVALATGRSKRPDEFVEKRGRAVLPKKYDDTCPFCNLAKYPQEPDVLRLPDDPDDWQVHIFANKYPAFLPRDEFRSWQTGPYRGIESVGYHELLATRWHNQTEARMSHAELELLWEALVLRYRQLKSKPSVNYIQIIRNHGPEAGASQPHPHHQLFTTPVLPSDVTDMLQAAETYAHQHDDNVFDAVLRFERESGERIVWENEHFTVLCPYASRVPFETWIIPRAPEPFFENLSPQQRRGLADAMGQLFRRLHIGLHDPPFNYFVHSAPCDETGFVCDRQQFEHFRWHIEVTPRLNTWGGFEMSTGLEINTVLPEEAAAFLRGVKVDSSL